MKCHNFYTEERNKDSIYSILVVHTDAIKEQLILLTEI